MAPPSSSQAPTSQSHAPLWLKVLVIVMGLLIVVGFIVVAAEIARRMSNASGASSPAGGSSSGKAAFTQRIALPSGAKVVSMQTTDGRLIVHVENQGGTTAAYIVDPRSGNLLGTIEFPPGAGR